MIIPMHNRLRDEDGATVVEYALLLMLIMSACVGGVTLVGTATLGNLQSLVWP